MSKSGGYAVLIHCEDEISRALANGLARGRKVVRLESDGPGDRRARARLMAMDIHQGRDAAWWSQKYVDHVCRYYGDFNDPTVWERIKDAIGTAWAVAWCWMMWKRGKL